VNARRARPAATLAALVGAAALAGPAAGTPPPGGGAASAEGARGVFVSAAAPGFRFPAERMNFGPSETDRCLVCHGMPAFLVRDSLSRAVRDLSVDGAVFRASVHGPVPCTGCHAEVRAWPHELPRPRPRVGCDADCHARDREGRPVRHTTQVADFRRGVHRGGLAGRRESPDCLTCHGADAHRTRPVKGRLSPAERVALCAPCHDDHVRMAARRVDPGAAASYRASFHGKAVRFGSMRAAACDDCHGVHVVLASRDTASTVSPARLPATCGRRDCHDGAGPSFARSGAAHLDRRVARAPLLGLTAALLAGLSGAVLVGLGGFVLLDVRRRVAGPDPALAALPVVLRPVAAHRAPEPLVARLTLAQRAQHWALMASFAALAATGLPLRYPEHAGLAALYAALGGLDTARLIHRAAGALMIATLAAHAAYAAALLARARFDVRRAWTMLPGRGDVRDAWQTVRWQLGRRAAPPAADRHEFRARLHYLAVLCGLPLMAASGLVLWFPVALGNRLPDTAIGMAILAHGDEAVLAVSVVILWHLYHVHVAPGAHHRFGTWLDGRITRGAWFAQHRLEAERTEAAARPGAPRADQPQPSSR